ncbi:MAG: hypothetical protein GXP29_14170 [Planctomycetes bacterium]|nr:hypothetical protein [Planctomycetota bacterium]
MRETRTTKIVCVSRGRHSFSLVELAIVIAIIAILGAIAVPRLTKASQRAEASALESNLTNIRKAIDRFYAEHQRFPGYDPATGAPDGLRFIAQLSKYSDFKGNSRTSPNATFKYGPYISLPFPTSPVNGLSTVHVRSFKSDSVPIKTTGWHAALEDGSFGLNSGILDFQTSLPSADVSGTIWNLPK